MTLVFIGAGFFPSGLACAPVCKCLRVLERNATKTKQSTCFQPQLIASLPIRTVLRTTFPNFPKPHPKPNPKIEIRTKNGQTCQIRTATGVAVVRRYREPPKGFLSFDRIRGPLRWPAKARWGQLCTQPGGDESLCLGKIVHPLFSLGDHMYSKYLLAEREMSVDD